MAINNHTTTTPEEFARLFPCTGRPFAVWYCEDDHGTGKNWSVNGEEGEAVADFDDMQTAFKTASEWGKEWEEEARNQALAIAKIRSKLAETDTVITKDKTRSSYLLEAVDKLDEVIAIANFVQSISVNVLPNQTVTLHPKQLSGFCYSMQNVINGMREASSLIEAARIC